MGEGDAHYRLLQRRGDAHAAAADYETAQGCYNQAARRAPAEAAPYVGLGHVFIHTGQLDRAERAFRIAIRLNSGCAEAYDGLAMLHQHRSQYPAAFETYLKCLELNPDNLVALLGLFQTSCRMGTFQRIIGYLERYLTGHPGDASVLLCLGSLYAREGRLRDACQALRQVLRAEPGKHEAAKLLAEVNNALLVGAAGAAG
jgi:tetratricopeptide (TPR) repeat protein